MSDAERRITEEELKRCDGQEGRPAWVAFRGKVYDVSGSERWSGGIHMKLHQVGKDLTYEFTTAPHDESVLQSMPVVGRLVAAEQTKAHPLLDAYLDLHPHPVSVHFPIALTLASAAFLILHLLTGIESLVDAAYYTLLGGVAIAPVTMLTGAVSWWFNYGHKLKSPFQGKAGLSMALAVVAAATVVLWALNREALLDREAVGWVYFALVMVMSGLVLSLGKLGGALVFPSRKKPAQKS
ncbi:MAG: hypothetical protein JW753_06335 [Dehalococcoidia bacterium]|nr:hypothetical protein [Dehalococcoidia bacterium]